MNKIQLFAQPNITALQLEINEWLTDHKDVHIVETNLTTLSPSTASASEGYAQAQYAFYILYIPADQEEQASIIAAAKQMPTELTDPRIIDTEVNTN